MSKLKRRINNNFSAIFKSPNYIKKNKTEYKKTTLILLMLSSVLFFTACGTASKEKEGDASSEVATIKIDTQEWASKNLDVATFRNGEAILEAKTDEEWKTAGVEGKPAWSYYKNDPKNGEKYGKLYNRHAVSDPRGLAPSGWHIPSYEEHVKLIKFLGGEKVAGEKLKSKEGWKGDKNGTDETGFSGFSGGYRDFKEFYNIGEAAMWWSTSDYNETLGWCFWLRDKSSTGTAYTSYSDHTYGGYVRCIKD